MKRRSRAGKERCAAERNAAVRNIEIVCRSRSQQKKSEDDPSLSPLPADFLANFPGVIGGRFNVLIGLPNELPVFVSAFNRATIIPGLWECSDTHILRCLCHEAFVSLIYESVLFGLFVPQGILEYSGYFLLSAFIISFSAVIWRLYS